MMKCLGFEVETELPSFEEFQKMFAPPLSPSKKEAMRVLFPSRRSMRVSAESGV